MDTDFGNSTSPLVAFILRNSIVENEFGRLELDDAAANASQQHVNFGAFLGYNFTMGPTRPRLRGRPTIATSIWQASAAIRSPRRSMT